MGSALRRDGCHAEKVQKRRYDGRHAENVGPRGQSRIGRPLGDGTFMERLESTVGCAMKPPETPLETQTRELSIVSPSLERNSARNSRLRSTRILFLT